MRGVQGCTVERGRGPRHPGPTIVRREAPVGPDRVLLGDHLPEPAPDLVPRLPRLDVQDLAHGVALDRPPPPRFVPPPDSLEHAEERVLCPPPPLRDAPPASPLTPDGDALRPAPPKFGVRN